MASWKIIPIIYTHAADLASSFLDQLLTGARTHFCFRSVPHFLVTSLPPPPRENSKRCIFDVFDNNTQQASRRTGSIDDYVVGIYHPTQYIGKVLSTRE